MPTSAQSLCLPPTYHRDPGSSPTSTVPSPGTTPVLAQRGHPHRQLGLDRGRGGGAVQLLCSHVRHPVHRAAVDEVPGAGEVHRHAGGLAPPRSSSSSRTEPPGCTIAATPASMRICGPSSNGKNASEAATDPAGPLPRPLDREPAGVDPVDLTHADADRGAVLGQQDRVGLHRAAGPPGEGQVGEHLGRRGLAGGERPRSPGRRPRRRRSRAACISRPAGDRPHLDLATAEAGRTPGAGCSSSPRAPRPRRRRTPARRRPR